MHHSWKDSKDFQQSVLQRAIRLQGVTSAQGEPLAPRTIQEVRSIAHNLGVSQYHIERALSEPIIFTPQLGQAGPLNVQRFVPQPPCQVHRSASLYLTTCEAMEIDAQIPNGFTFISSYDGKRFAYDHTEPTMWSLTGLTCNILPHSPEGVILSITADMPSERVAAIGGAVAVASATTPICLTVHTMFSVLPFTPLTNQIIGGLIGVTVGGTIGAVIGRLWWREEVKRRIRVLTRAIQGIVSYADADGY
ncbi:hypothetical protein [Stomatohabitans albus]|uniref:hypothetical protein n=1 Tax=Stomatohabitans albus TaxID=3110766 RepID=UPI00300C51E5